MNKKELIAKLNKLHTELKSEEEYIGIDYVDNRIRLFVDNSILAKELDTMFEGNIDIIAAKRKTNAR